MNQLIQALQRPEAYDHPVAQVQLLETHISWVLLTGQFAYKIKKPVDFGFLDFSTLDKRRQCCDEELRLNARFSEDIYLEVIEITGSPDDPHIGGSGPAIEYAVKMRQFSQDALLDSMLDRGELLPRHIDALAAEVAEFHARIAVADADSPYGTPQAVWEPVAENFRHLNPSNLNSDHRGQVDRLREWAEVEFERRRPDFQARRQAGFVRECHGDLHLRNMILQGARVLLFDCIEFNSSLRWIDVLSEIAFTVMDLGDRGRDDLAARFLNAYLQQAGDYAGLPVLRYYLVYRATVRAKVTALRLAQPDLTAEERAADEELLQSYLDLAERYTQTKHPQLILTHGLSGSGKSTLTQELLQQLPAVRLRSDVERKRLFAAAESETSLYSEQATLSTYQRLAQAARHVLDGGFTAIVDATFLKRQFRDEFRSLADEVGVPLVILDLTAPVDELRDRLRKRHGDVSDADLSVLEWQINNQEPLASKERPHAVPVNTDNPVSIDELIEQIRLKNAPDAG